MALATTHDFQDNTAISINTNHYELTGWTIWPTTCGRLVATVTAGTLPRSTETFVDTGCSTARRGGIPVDGGLYSNVQLLLGHREGEGLSSGMIKSRLLRWCAEKIGKAGENAQPGVPKRRYETNTNKAKELGAQLEPISYAHVHINLQLQAALGLRREDSIKYLPAM